MTSDLGFGITDPTGLTSITDDQQFEGLTEATYSSPSTSDLGNGGGGPSDWLGSALTTFNQGAAAVSNVVSLVNGRPVVSQNGMIQPIATGTAGPLQSANTANVSFFQSATGIVVLVVAGLIILAIAAFSFLIPKRKK